MFISEDVFHDTLPACLKMQELAGKVFEHNAEHVLAKFVHFVFEKKLTVSLTIILCFAC